VDGAAGLDAERRNERAERELVDATVLYEVGLGDSSQRAESLSALRSIVGDLRRRAGALRPSADRDIAQRVLELITYAPYNRVRDQEYLSLLLEAAPRR
jgi:hypothetical protein